MDPVASTPSGIVPALLWTLAVLVSVAGVAGVFVPGLPGPPLLFAGLFLAAWADGFVHVGAGILVVLAVLAALSYAVDFLGTAVGAKRYGAGRRAVVGAVIGTVVGLFFGVPGIVFGPFVGAVLAELTARGGWRKAVNAGIGTWVGLVLGTLGKLALSLAMVGVFLFARFF